MLVDQDDADVFPLGREALKGGLDGGIVCLAVDDEEVLLVVGGCGDMLPGPVLDSFHATRRVGG